MKEKDLLLLANNFENQFTVKELEQLLTEKFDSVKDIFKYKKTGLTF